MWTIMVVEWLKLFSTAALPTSCQMWNLPFKNWVDGSPLRAKISRKTSRSSSSQLNEIRVKIQRSLCYISIASKILSLPSSRLDFSGRGKEGWQMCSMLQLLGEKSLFSGYVIRRQMLGGSWNQCPFKRESWLGSDIWCHQSPRNTIEDCKANPKEGPRRWHIRPQK